MINLPKVALTIPKGIKIGAPTEEIRMVWKVTLGMKHPVVELSKTIYKTYS